MPIALTACSTRVTRRDPHRHATMFIGRRKTSLLQDRSDGVRSSAPTFAPASRPILRTATAQSARRKRIARSLAAAGNARNDLLFTMSDNRVRDVRPAVKAAPPSWPQTYGPRPTARSVSDEHRPLWWSQTGSNRRPPACKAGALPTELWPRNTRGHLVAQSHGARSRHRRPVAGTMVGLGRFELPTSRLSSARSNQLSYKPLIQTNGSKARSGSLARQSWRDQVRARPRRKRSVDGGAPPMGSIGLSDRP